MLREKADDEADSVLLNAYEFYGDEAIIHSFLACTTRQPFDVSNTITAISGWTTWQLPSS